MKESRNLQIEGLRGFAILIIVIFHIIYQFHNKYLTDIPMGFVEKCMARWGQFGVLIFLMISVWFMIPMKNTRGSLIKIVFKKIVRLWPTYAISITITYLLTRIVELPGRTVNLWEFIFNLTMLEGFFGIAYVDGAHWYLTTLIALTLCITIIEKYLKEKRFSYLGWISFCVGVHFLPAQLSILGRLVAADYVGVAVFIIYLKQFLQTEHFIQNWKQYFPEFGIMLVAVCYTLIMNDVIYLVMLVIATILFIYCYKNKLKIMKNSCFIFVGKISYSLYLIHQNVSYIIEYRLMEIYGEYHYTFAFVAMLVVLILAVILTKFVEQLMRKLINNRE